MVCVNSDLQLFEITSAEQCETFREKLLSSQPKPAATGLHRNKNKLARSATNINQKPPNVCGFQIHSWNQSSQPDLLHLCCAVKPRANINFPVKNAFFACVEIENVGILRRKPLMVCYCAIWLVLVHWQSQTWNRKPTSKAGGNGGRNTGIGGTLIVRRIGEINLTGRVLSGWPAVCRPSFCFQLAA